MKRVVTIQDISCIGKCSLTVALPILSAAGVETAVIPTALLSTHTAFNRFEFFDLTDKIEPIANHFYEEGFGFDAIYTGYLGSFEQLKTVSDFIDRFKSKGTLVVIDPVMGDNGKLYSGFDRGFAHSMANLCKKADIIIPNLTESAFLLGMDEVPQSPDFDTVKSMLKKLTELGPKIALMTGVSNQEGQLGAMGYNSETDTFFGSFCEHIQATFHGTGDIFASAFVGATLGGATLDSATETAVEFTSRSIKATLNDKDGRWYGVNFESALPWFINHLKGAYDESIPSVD